jgi:hypothetical protein
MCGTTMRQLFVCVKRAGGNGAVSARLTQQSWFRIGLSAIFDIADQGAVPDPITAEYFAPFRAITDKRAALETARFTTAMYVQNIDLQMVISTLGAWIRPLASLDKLRMREVHVQWQQALSKATPRERMAAVKQLAETPHLSMLVPFRPLYPWRLFSTDPFFLWEAYDVPDVLLIS